MRYYTTRYIKKLMDGGISKILFLDIFNYQYFEVFLKMTVLIEQIFFLVLFGTNHHFITYILIPESMKRIKEINSMALPLCLNNAS